ncbi:terminase large subunit [Butyrivibrio sp. FC2001]|uniref:terminase large subunit n=1 Tax=Butyrivibrio sp. FC2001 TaxID=1280671 RepID=UPI00047DAB43
MLPTSHYDKKKADHAVNFIQQLSHTKGKWAGQKIKLLPWEEQIIRDIFGIIGVDGYRQFRNAYITVSKKNGKSTICSAICLYLLYADGEPSPEVYSAACDRNQASIVYNEAEKMVAACPALLKRSKVMKATKRIVSYNPDGFYQVLSAETGSKHGLNISGLIFDELHAQKTRDLYDTLTKYSGSARTQPLFISITTAGNNKESICYELHTKALDILNGKRHDPSFYPAVFCLEDGDDWELEANWYKANPSLGYTLTIERFREDYINAIENPAELNVFKQLRLNMWVSSSVQWIPEHIFDLGNEPVDEETLRYRDCYAGLDLSSTSDITAFVLVFPPRTEDEKYIVIPYFWLPEDTLELRCKRDHVMYDVWEQQGYINVTSGNVIDYRFVQDFIEKTCEKYHVLEIAYDRWNATMLVQNLIDEGLTMVPYGQGYKDMSPAAKELYKLLMEGKVIHGGNPVLKWMASNVVMEQDPAGNIKPTKAKSIEKIDGIVALIMAMGRAVVNEGSKESVYDTRNLIVF